MEIIKLLSFVFLILAIIICLAKGRNIHEDRFNLYAYLTCFVISAILTAIYYFNI